MAPNPWGIVYCSTGRAWVARGRYTIPRIMTRSDPSYSTWRDQPAILTEDDLEIGGWKVMQRWEQPLMAALARAVTAGRRGDILEVGFGMGISAQEIVEAGCRTYTVIEAHPEIAAQARKWASRQRIPTRVIEGYWEDVHEGCGQFDGILFDTYPLTAEQRGRNHFPFIPVAPGLLRPGGLLTHYSDETLDFSSEHLRLLLTHFDEVRLFKVSGLKPPPDCGYWASDTMVIPVATVGSGPNA